MCAEQGQMWEESGPDLQLHVGLSGLSTSKCIGTRPNVGGVGHLDKVGPRMARHWNPPPDAGPHGGFPAVRLGLGHPPFLIIM
jgi:hypothetical protein